jgi:hypothetical protein
MASITHYTKKSFENCLFNPLAEGKMLDTYPALSEIIAPEWAEESLLDGLIRYTILVYDPKSALVNAERDLNYRKGIAADLAGFDMEYEDQLTAIYNCAFPMMPDLIMRYLRRFARSKEWAAICAIEFKYWESIKKMMEPLQGKTSNEELVGVQKKSAIADEIEKDIFRLDMLYKVFFGEDGELERKAKKRMTPELMAEKKERV